MSEGKGSEGGAASSSSSQSSTGSRGRVDTSHRLKVHRSNRFKIIFGLVVSCLFIYFVFREVERDELLERIRNVHVGYLLLAIVLTFLSYVLRSIRWPLFFVRKPPGFVASFTCVILGFFVNNILPARIGELVRAHLGGKATGQSRSTVLATVAGERLADGLMISLLFAVLYSLYTPPGGENVKELYYVSYLFLLAGVGTIVFLLFRERFYKLLERLGRIMPGNLSSYTLVRVRYFIEGLTPLLRIDRAIGISVLSVIVWSVELLAYNYVAVAFDHPLGIGGLTLFLAAVNFSSLIPAAPAGVGVIEWFGKLALTKIGVDPETALAMVATQHLIQFSVIGVPGVLLFLLKLGGKLPDADEEQDLEADSNFEEKSFVDVSEPQPEQTAGIAPEQVVPEVMGEACDISVVIPAYNEELRLPKTLLSVVEYFKSRGGTYEILVVDDGSTDKTSQIVRQFEVLSPHVRLLVYPQNRGKGYAVRFGMLNARGHRLLFNDADGATPIEEVERLEESLLAGANVAIGSRAMYSRETAVATVWYRKIIGRTFNGIVNLLLLPGIADTQCGFKLFEHHVARHIFSRQRAERFSFDCEILYLARKSGCRIVEVPINWTNIPGSKVNLVKDSAAMFVDLLKFRLRDFFGGYGDLRLEKPASQK